jgi:uncharacterized protein (TIGR00299 family) protein
VKIAYFDCSAGISGDMCLGALVDAGVSLKELERGLRALHLGGYTLQARKVKRSSIAGTKVDVIVRQSVTSGDSLRRAAGSRHPARRWADIEKIVKTSSLSAPIKQNGLKIFKRLFEAEGKVHGKAFNRTHLHELGAVDCMVDVFGTLIGLDLLGIDNVYSSALNLGSGVVMTNHGRLPVPAPATAELLRGVPVYASGASFELTTPTGAAILREMADFCVNMPLMMPERIGYGAGQKEVEGSPNVLRIFVGEEIPGQRSGQLPKVTVIETNIDDMNPQIYEYVMERLFLAGALDVSLTQMIMKKGRPGILLTVLCEGEKRADIMDIILKETTTIGLRFYEAWRIVLERKGEERETDFGKVRIKSAGMSDGTVKLRPEYEDCRTIARKRRIPLVEVMRRLDAAEKKPRKVRGRKIS